MRQDLFKQVLVRDVVGASGVALLSWIAPHQGDRLVQVYVDGDLYDVSAAAEDREMWLELGGRESARIQLAAVRPHLAWEDYAHRLEGWTPPFVSGAQLAVIRDERLPVAARGRVRVDDQQAGEDRIWEPMVSRAGFGGLFGYGGFGLDYASGPGLGLGEFGLGAFGADGAAWRWREPGLPAGEHQIGLTVTDRDGRLVGRLDHTQTIEVDPPPQGAGKVTMDEGFVLRWGGE